MRVSYVSAREIKTQADTLRSQYQDDYVTDIEGIATRKLNLSIHFFELQNLYGRGTLGMVLPDEKLILCEKFLEPHGKNKDNLERILRFTIAHEIGHYVLHRRYMGDCESPVFHKNLPDKERQNLEIQANMFAAELLMPEDCFRKAYHYFISNFECHDQAEIKTYLSNLFHISKDAVKNRMNKLKL
ncbi:MAG: ImmA/IrrE family metallo-endopeptidase [Alphaproteobacteria bacterium]